MTFFDIAVPLFVVLLLLALGVLCLSAIVNLLLEGDITVLFVPIPLAGLALVVTGLYFYIPSTALLP